MNIAEKMEIFNNQQTGASSGFERNLAFIIGIDNYQNGIPSLKTAANDAKKFAEVLESKHQYQARICLNSDATLSNLYQFLEEILPAQVTENDRLLFYFAGHGTIDGEGDDGPTGYFLPQDAIRGEITTYLPMTRLYESLNKLPCRHFLGILDCCFAGAFRWLTTRDLLTSPDKIYQERYERYIQDPAWQIITAAAYDQKALDVDPFAFERGQIGNHSPFTGALLEALSGTNKDNPFSDGVITAQKLSSYLRDRVEPATAAINRRQTPVLIPLRRHDKGEYIFLSPGHPLNLELAPPLNEKDNPYKGLLSFEEEDSKLFFGRKALTQQLCERVIQQPLTIVLGASGSGKSSLVKAGLIPYIKENYQHWHILSPIRPGESPFRALRNAFAKDNLPVAAVTTLGTQQKVDSLFANIDTWFNLNSNSGLLIVIDQLEELVTLAYNEQEREAFLQFLATALKKYPQRLRIVFTLRIDFEAQLRNHALETYWQATGARFLVEDMTREELRQVIEEPASKAVIFFEPHSLVENLIDEVYRMPGALPLLSFTLSELYLKYFSSVKEEGRNNRAITQADYQQLGGILGSITKRADEEYYKLVSQDKDYESTISNIMLRMVAVGDGELARRRVPELELIYPEPENSRVENVINRFVDARLLVKDEDEESKSYVEPAHDALISRWEKILAWKKQKQEDVILQRRLTPAAQEWKTIESKEQLSGFSAKVEPAIDWLDKKLYVAENSANKINAQLLKIVKRKQHQQKPSENNPVQYLWNANPYLDVLSEQLESSSNWFNQVEAEFIQKSVLQKRQNTSWRWRIATAVILGLTGLSIATYIGQQSAQIGQVRASRESAEANFRANEQLNAFVDSLRAGKNIKGIFSPPNELPTQVEQTLRNMFYSAKEINRWQAPSGIVHSMFFSSGRLITITDDNGKVRLWKDGKEPVELKGQQGLSRGGISVSPDESKIATATQDGVVRLWDLQGNKSDEFKAHQGAIDNIKFSPDGKMIATIGEDKKTVRLWDLQGNKIKAGKSYQGTTSIIGLGFKPSGQLLIATSQEIATSGETPPVNQIKVLGWSGDNLQKLAEYKTSNSIHTITFSPNGNKALIYYAEESENADLWNFSDSSKPEPKPLSDIINGKNASNTGDNIYRISMASSFSPDRKQLAVTGVDGTVNLLNDNNEVQSKFKLPQGRAQMSIFSPDGKQILTLGDDRNIRLWDLERQPPKLPSKLPPNLKSISFSPDGKTIAVADSQKVLRLLDLNGNPSDKPFPKLSNTTSVSFSPDGKKIAATVDCGMVRLLDLQSNSIREFKAHPNEVNSVSWSQDGQKISTIGDGGDDSPDTPNNNCKVKDGQKISTMEDGGDDSPDTPNNNSSVKLWDTKGKFLDKLDKKQGDGRSNFQSISFQSDGNPVIISKGDIDQDTGNINSLDLSGNQVNIIPGRQSRNHLQKVEISHDASLLLTTEDATTDTKKENILALWNLKGGNLMTFSVNNDIKSLSLSNDNSMLAVMTKDGKTELWQLGKFDELLSKGCERARNYLQNNPNVAKSDRNLCDDVGQ